MDNIKGTEEQTNDGMINNITDDELKTNTANAKRNQSKDRAV